MTGIRLGIVRLARLGLLVLAVVCLREAQSRRQAEVDAGALAVPRVRDALPRLNRSNAPASAGMSRMPIRRPTSRQNWKYASRSTAVSLRQPNRAFQRIGS